MQIDFVHRKVQIVDLHKRVSSNRLHENLDDAHSIASFH
jgi:hypothetical protein